MIILRPFVLQSITVVKRPAFSQTFRLLSTTQQSTSTTTAPVHESLDSTPIEFLSNLTAPKFIPSTRNIAKVLSCTDDTTDSKLQTTHIPFEVKAKESTGVRAQSTDKSLKKLIQPYIQLSKPRLSALVVLSAICSYALAPLTATVPQLIFLTIGTGLCSASANAINQGREPEFDKLMVRTGGRPIVRGLLTPLQAYKFSAAAGVIGVATLYFGVNETVALLGASNIILYGWIYTSLKRKSILNTWVGAIVGAIPPLMGWAASSSLTHPGAWCLAALLYAWQFPHFNALSHGIRNEYRNAGYVMTAWTNPRLNARVGFRYALLMFPICIGLTYFGITDSVFLFDSGLINGWLSYWAFKFWNQQRMNYRNGGTPDAQGLKLATIYAKKTFWGSVWHLPGILVLAMLHKKGRWDWLVGDQGYFKP